MPPARWVHRLLFITAWLLAATIVRVLTALGVATPPAAGFEPVGAYTQDNRFNPSTEAILPPARTTADAVAASC